jgi:hypothetical protein
LGASFVEATPLNAPIGLQLYTVGAEMDRDPAGTLKAVAAAGYTAVELSPLAKTPAKDLKRMLNDAGLKNPSGHYMLPDLMSKLPEMIELAKLFGQEYMIVTVPWVADPTRFKPDPQGGEITPRTQKAISSLKEQLWDGEKGTHYLIFVVNSNTVMSHDPFDQDAEGSPAECRSWPVAASNRASRSSASVVTRVRLVRAPSISLLARSLPTRWTDRSSRSHCANHLEASTANRRTAAEIREKQWPDHWSDRSQRIKCISARPKKAWLNRVKIAAHFKFKFLIRLIACSSRSSRGLTRFWCHVASTP